MARPFALLVNPDINPLAEKFTMTCWFSIENALPLNVLGKVGGGVGVEVDTFLVGNAAPTVNVYTE